MQHRKRGLGTNKAGYKGYSLYSNYLKGIKPVKNVITGKKTRGDYQLRNVAEFNGILSEINDNIFKAIIEDNLCFKMPYNLGTLRVRKKRRVYKLDENNEVITKSFPVNWPETTALWDRDEESRLKKTVVYYTNSHSQGFKFNFLWSKKLARTNNITVIAFKVTRSHSRELAKHIFKTGTLNYFE